MKIKLNENLISPFVFFVIKKLKRKGNNAFLVGGSVRDLILNIKPKDYDIATNANPYKIKSIFKNSYIIGKRFKLVQIFFKKTKIEISTFRKDPGKPPENLSEREKLIWANKFFGTQKEDAKRRDFTINSLYYDPTNYELFDFTGGYEDLKNKIIKTIGNPYERFMEDPVRIIRACALSCRLDFKIEKETEEAIDLLYKEIISIPKARIQEELLRILKSGYSFKILNLLEEKKILKDIFPFPYEFNLIFKNALKMIDKKYESFSDDEIFLFLYFAIFFQRLIEGKDLDNFDKESFLFRKGFLNSLELYKQIIKVIFSSKKPSKKYFKNKNFYKVLKFSSKLCTIYPEFRKNFLNWKTFYFINRKNF